MHSLQDPLASLQYYVLGTLAMNFKIDLHKRLFETPKWVAPIAAWMFALLNFVVILFFEFDAIQNRQGYLVLLEYVGIPGWFVFGLVQVAFMVGLVAVWNVFRRQEPNERIRRTWPIVMCVNAMNFMGSLEFLNRLDDEARRQNYQFRFWFGLIILVIALLCMCLPWSKMGVYPSSNPAKA